MTLEQQAHLSRLTYNFALVLSTKYAKGAIEHGGNLWDKTPIQLLDEAIDECIDQFTYLMTLRSKMTNEMR